MFFSEEDQELEAGLMEELLSLLQPAGDSINNNSQNSGSEGSTGRGAVFTDNERKRRRMISNRESARRSRWRKKRHLEELTEQLDRLKQENREIKNQLGLVAHRYHVAWRENDRLSSEFLALRSRLSDLCRILVAMQSSQQ